ncbi:hypothetical protein CANTEDRAFT_121444 [Yamadazyma tenuis ATCC 10573]|uniref:Transcription factor MBP1 n=1 Tax=Candida tenuis (strain ATCC 10573 / BCRC 21748 / CBS 615 / JCM 9827 / NBRC 10315 / NRRL Y-1498 / VKM Y-70) TaxID=590646 RepID=G3B460_CANTC|nr:uncharacterized protein CANTEDRAFT_121444 [Yamadazyma tenuis ATCC 10573]EGV63779.1 hypothetical protein CANTEDRAFT_121444 [Yamadazyma tenuis ATCC 10573]
MSDKQIYSATYSNVPVFEYVTSEGPIMRRKADSWINATHILKIAKFPKARRTRILEKDVQTGIHEKVQGGYGKYQGTYIPLNLGAELAKTFGVYNVLRPIFDFTYIEGKTATPPPAPKHNHASASNVANRNNSNYELARKSKSTNSINEPPRKRGRPKRVTLNQPPALKHNDTTPIMGESNTASFRKAVRQDTEQDALSLMANHMSQQNRMNHQNVKDEDLELVDNTSDDIEDANEDDGFLSGKELFGTPRNSFERIVNFHNNANPTLMASYSRMNSHDPYGLSQYHHPQQNNQLRSFKDDQIYGDYFTNLLNFFLEDNQSQGNPAPTTENTPNAKTEKKTKDTVIPKNLLNPPQPISKININQPVDNDGNTIFHWACSMANYAMIEFLINSFPNIINSTLKNNNGETPLMFLIKFSNSYQLKNFPNLLDLLFDSILSVDIYNKTVLHHIALSVIPPQNMVESSFNGNDESQLNNYLKNKERIARYYIEQLFTKIIEFQDFNNNDTSANELIRKFINHQDSDGNTAFHLIAYNLNKKLIKVFISYHEFIEFGKKNLVNYSVEEYLASHNYILKLENDQDDSQDSKAQHLISDKATNSESFESQLYYSKMTVNLTNTTSNLITEKLTELQFSIDKELNEKDEKLLKLITTNSKFQAMKVAQQKLILKIFKLDYLIKDIGVDLQVLDLKRDRIIQDEISRFLNDLTFQVLQKKEKLDKKVHIFKTTYSKTTRLRLTKSEAAEVEATNGPEDKFQLSVALQQEIIKSNKLLAEFYKLQPKVPVFNKDDFKENGGISTTSNFPSDDKLNKYCKLISLCCGMDIADVESSIDSIEQSLMKSMNSK